MELGHDAHTSCLYAEAALLRDICNQKKFLAPLAPSPYKEQQRAYVLIPQQSVYVLTTSSNLELCH